MMNLLTLLDDVAATLDDVALMTKRALYKTSAVMADDLAVNAGVVTNVYAHRELPIVYQIFVGSLLNKVYCIVGMMLILATYPPLLTVILLCGGGFLCYEGAHKVFEKLFQKKQTYSERIYSEKERVQGAVRTDLILSVEIMVIAHSQMSGSLLDQVLSLILVGLAASVLIYGLVAIIVKVDDFGLFLIQRGQKLLGMALVRSMPYMMKLLGITGTIALFLVGGGIFTHTFHVPLITTELLQNMGTGIIVGSVLVGAGHLLPRRSARGS